MTTYEQKKNIGDTVYITMKDTDWGENGDTFENDFHPIKLKDIKKDELFVKKPTTRLVQNVLCKDEYIRQSKKFLCLGYENSKECYISGETIVYIGFSY